MTFKPYAEFIRDFDTEPKYTRRQMAEAIRRCEEQHTVNRVIQKGKDCDIALQILAIHSTPEGIIVIVK